MATVLVVDDNPADRALISAVLAPRGHAVLHAEDGRQGLELAAAEHPDLIVSDILMPRMDGYELAHAARSDPRTASIPLMFYTAQELEPRFLALASSCGVSLFLPKPSDAAEIADVVERALASPPAAAPADDEVFDRDHLRLVTDALHRRVEELKTMNARLAESEERFRSLIENAPDGIVGVDEAGRIQLLNTRAEELFGYPRDELIGRSVELLVPEEARGAHVRNRAGYVAEARPRLMGSNREVRGRRRDGSLFPAGVNLSVLRTDDGTVAIAMVRDISERVRAEQDRALLEAQLQQAQRMESIGQLAGGVAHDFNNLLMVIRNYADWAIEQLEYDDPVRADIDEIRRASERAAALTHQLLIFSRREAVKPEILDLNAVVEELEKLLRRTLGEHITFETELALESLAVNVDPGQIEQVLINLALNARDAMPDGGTLRIETDQVQVEAERWPGRELEAGVYVRMSVTDSGVGMDESVRERAFEPFFTTKPRGQGTGLGLSTVFGITTQGGGNVRLYSEPGHGTTVAVYLPMAEAAPDPRASGPEPATGKGQTILLVEDEDAVRAICVRILTTNGYDVIAADGPIQALELWERDRDAVDLLLTDVVMPLMSGRELADRLRTNRPELRVLFMSGYPSDFLSDEDGQAGRPRRLRKPFGHAELLAAVAEGLAARVPERGVDG